MCIKNRYIASLAWEFWVCHLCRCKLIWHFWHGYFCRNGLLKGMIYDYGSLQLVTLLSAVRQIKINVNICILIKSTQIKRYENKWHFYVLKKWNIKEIRYAFNYISRKCFVATFRIAAMGPLFTGKHRWICFCPVKCVISSIYFFWENRLNSVLKFDFIPWIRVL